MEVSNYPYILQKLLLTLPQLSKLLKVLVVFGQLLARDILKHCRLDRCEPLKSSRSSHYTRPNIVDFSKGPSSPHEILSIPMQRIQIFQLSA